MRFALRNPLVADRQVQQNLEDLLGAVNSLAGVLFWGTGAPTFTPPGPAVFLRVDGGATSTLYVYDLSTPGWTAK